MLRLCGSLFQYLVSGSMVSLLLKRSGGFSLHQHIDGILLEEKNHASLIFCFAVIKTVFGALKAAFPDPVSRSGFQHGP